MRDLRGKMDERSEQAAFGNIDSKLHDANARPPTKPSMRRLEKCVVPQGIDTQTAQGTLQISVSSEKATDCQVVFSLTMRSMQGSFPKTPAQISNARKRCVEQPLELGHQTTVATDCNEPSEGAIALRNTFTKDNLFTCGDSLT